MNAGLKTTTESILEAIQVVCLIFQSTLSFEQLCSDSWTGK